MPLLTYLVWLQPIYYNPRLVFKHVKTEKNFACGENFSKKHRVATTVATTLISSHTSKIKIIAPSKYIFQNTGALENCSLEKCISKLIFLKL